MLIKDDQYTKKDDLNSDKTHLYTQKKINIFRRSNCSRYP